MEMESIFFYFKKKISKIGLQSYTLEGYNLKEHPEIKPNQIR